MKYSPELKIQKPIYVASPLLPDLEELLPHLNKIWDSKYVTNHGSYHNELENRLETFLEVPTAKLFNNGSIALITALKMFDFSPGDEIITTPFTFAATPHAISWNNLKPVFADIKESDYTIDPVAIRKAITPKTKGILAVHVYGNICDVEEIQKIADEHNLKVVYDAAHAFGVKYKGVGIGNFGDATVFSFHATKLYNTLEGGMIATPNANDREKIYMLRNFGIKNEEEVVEVGINGKMNEVQAAIGLLNLKGYHEELRQRASIRQSLDAHFAGVNGIYPSLSSVSATNSQQYYPIRVVEREYGMSRDELYTVLKSNGIIARKYFYPSCLRYTPYLDYEIVTAQGDNVTKVVENEILCLPFYSAVKNEITKITLIIK